MSGAGPGNELNLREPGGARREGAPRLGRVRGTPTFRSAKEALDTLHSVTLKDWAGLLDQRRPTCSFVGA